MSNLMLHDQLNQLTGLMLNQHDDLHGVLSNYLDHMINNDFPGLVNLLYRIDVDEEKLKRLLRQHASTNAASIMATMIIERQLAKSQTSSPNTDTNDQADQERW